MKPLSELVKVLRSRFHADCADELQAWIDEWHKEFEQAAANQRPDIMGPRYEAAIAETRKWIRESLLGTTQKPKQEDGK